jgi:hypothetical protein
MSGPPPSISAPPPGFIWTGVLAFCVACVAPVLAYFAGRGAAAAQLQTALNDAFRSLMVELQGERSVLVARVTELEGRNRQLEQQSDSLKRLLQRNNIDIPTLLKGADNEDP